ncbi:MAG: sodium:proton antiporter [Verrucomicrobia bacterium]|nr:sodium:proton antiporter [Verrucomicrobiota bacterium]
MHHYVVNPWMILPFGILLAAIAVMPLAAHRWWGHHYPKVSLVLGATTLFYYLGALREFHRPLASAHEYVSFICLIGSLFVISGGIHIRVRGEARPWVNTMMLAIGGILANVVGTTGASMLLIRPFLRMNKYRLTTYHVVFFIFIVSNVGGSLTPIGDPPLYLGYLKGIPFFWTVRALFLEWLMGMAWLLGVFYIMDWRNFMRAPPEVRERETSHESWNFEGLNNLIWMGMVLAALFISHPVFLREAIMVFAAFMSWRRTRPDIYEANDFTWAPIREVAVLFAGIFATMMPALDWLEANATRLGVTSVGSFYWGSGLLSSVLDNAPTYLNYLSAAIGLFVDQTILDGVRHLLSSGGMMAMTGHEGARAGEILRAVAALKRFHPETLRLGVVTDDQIQIAYLLGNHAAHLAAISIGAVFFGASTYIGNGPNFMVKSIAEHWGAKMPSFFGFILKFTIPILLPMFVAVWWIFFRSG